jgi:solute:Na+ symporter, SSS family
LNDLTLDLLFATLLYVVVLVVIGFAARQKRQDGTLGDVFLANRTLGPGVLLLTLFATQYSANSFQGFPGQTYREGLAYFMSVPFMIAIVAGYTLFAPRLFALSRRHQFLTPTDYLEHRYALPALNYLSAAVFIVALGNFILAQLIALGQVFSTLTNNAVPYSLVVVTGGAVVLVYQLMGGMRAVAWADVFQGTVLALGLLVIGWLVWVQIGSPAGVVSTVELLRPDLVESPDWNTNLIWLSNLALLALGAPLYPQAIQRIFAAQRLKALRTALATLAVVPLVATSIVIFVGAAGIALFPQLDRFAADQVTFRVVEYLQQTTAVAYYPAILIALAVVAAILSTADSCLLTLSSIVVKDVVARTRRVEGEALDRLTRLVPWISIVLTAVLVMLAMRPLTTLWGLLIIKFEILIQLSPAFVLGTLHDRGAAGGVQAREILAGMVTGLVVTLVLYLSGLGSVYGLHAGTVGVALNYAVVTVMWRVRMGQRPLSLRGSTGAAAR